LNFLIGCGFRFKYDPALLKEALFPRPATVNGTTSGGEPPRKRRKVDEGSSEASLGDVNDSTQCLGIVLETSKAESYLLSPSSSRSEAEVGVGVEGSGSGSGSGRRYDVSLIVRRRRDRMGTEVKNVTTGRGPSDSEAKSGSLVTATATAPDENPRKDEKAVTTTETENNSTLADQSLLLPPPITGSAAAADTTAVSPVLHPDPHLPPSSTTGPAITTPGTLAESVPSASGDNQVHPTVTPPPEEITVAGTDVNETRELQPMVGGEIPVTKPSEEEGEEKDDGLVFRVLRSGVVEGQVEFGERGLKVFSGTGSAPGAGDVDIIVIEKVERWRKWG
jgi:hypothetical protein